MKKLLSIISLLVIISGCTGSSKTNFNKEKTFLGNIQDENGDMALILNAETSITTVNPKYREELVLLSKNMMKEYHKLLDSHHYYLDNNNNRITNIKVLNDCIDLGPMKVDPIIIDALKQAKTLTTLTNGYFNITIGKLSDLYYDKLLPYDSKNIDPSNKGIEETLQGVLAYDELNKYIVIDDINNTVELKSKGDNKYCIDLGAFSKGYILNKVYEKLIEYDTSFLISAGSSSIVAYTNQDENINWNVGIKKPDSLDGQLLAFSLKDGAISTSGDYENYYFLEDGTRRHHILNPYTGFPENFYRSNTLVSSNAYVIDALSTALFNVKDANERKAIIENIENYYSNHIEYCFVDKNINLVMNQGFFDILIDEYTSKSIQNINIE